jgi:hypothetical protein
MVTTENEEMVNKTLEYINQCAYNKHLAVAKEKARLEALAAVDQFGNKIKRQASKATTEENAPPNEDAEAENNEDGKPKIQKNSEDESLVVNVPATDQFEVTSLPDVCLNQDACLDFAENGVFLSLIKRKDIVRLDSKYMIKIAEVRGIFGDLNNKNKMDVPKIVQNEKSLPREPSDYEYERFNVRRKSSYLETLISRINAPTQASIKRCHYHRISSSEHKIIFFDPCQALDCPKYRTSDYCSTASDTKLLDVSLMETRARKWWKDTVKYVKKNIANIKKKKKSPFPLMLAKGEYDRSRYSSNRTLYPLAVRMLEFQDYSSDE